MQYYTPSIRCFLSFFLLLLLWRQPVLTSSSRGGVIFYHIICFGDGTAGRRHTMPHEFASDRILVRLVMMTMMMGPSCEVYDIVPSCLCYLSVISQPNETKNGSQGNDIIIMTYHLLRYDVKKKKPSLHTNVIFRYTRRYIDR